MVQNESASGKIAERNKPNDAGVKYFIKIWIRKIVNIITIIAVDNTSFINNLYYFRGFHRKKWNCYNSTYKHKQPK